MTTIRIIYNKIDTNASMKAAPICECYPQSVLSSTEDNSLFNNSVCHPGLTAIMHQAQIHGRYDVAVSDVSEISYYVNEIGPAIAPLGFTVKVSESTSTPFIVNGTTYTNLSSAIQAIGSTGGVVKLTADCTNDGVIVAEGSSFVLDLNGYEITFTNPGAGSTGTKNQGMQLLKDSDIIIKNGYIKVNDELKFVIQNYSNLTLDNVKLYGAAITKYILSNNYGNIVLKNHTEIHPSHGEVAFDLWYGMGYPGPYDTGVKILIADNSVVIDGKVEYDKDNRADEQHFIDNCSLIIPEDMELNVVTPGYTWNNLGTGMKKLVKA